MSVIDFLQPFSLDAGNRFDSFFYALNDRNNYEIYDASSSRFVVTLDNAVGPVKYVGFFPETTFRSYVQGFKSGVVETIVIYDANQEIIAVFDDLHTSLQSVFYIPNLSVPTGFAGTTVLGGPMDFLGSAGNDVFSAASGIGPGASAGNDTLNGAGGNDTLHGDAGDDIILGGAGNDRLFGEGGTDVLYGQDGDDYLDGGADGNLLDGGAGNDSLYGGVGAEFLIGGAGNDILSGGGGLDRVFYDEAISGITVNLSLGSAQVVGGGMGTDTLLSIEDVTGSDFNDVILGSDADNVIWAGYGDDSVTGGLGNDEIIGDSGDDTLIGGGGNDTLTGFIGSDYVDAGDGDDVVVLEHLDLTDTMIGGAGTDILRFDIGASPVYPTLNFSSFEGLGFQHFRTVVSLSDTLLKQFGVDGSGRPAALIVGGIDDPDGMGGQLTINMSAAGTLDLSQLVFTNWSGTPPVSVGAGRGLVEIIGTAGADTVVGTGEVDSIDGGAGADDLNGGNGDDTLKSDGVGDVLNGGAGDDTAKFDWSAHSGDLVFSASGFSIDGVDQSLTLISIERIHVVSGTGADFITGMGGADYVKVDGLNDTLNGGAGTDALEIDLSTATQALTLSATSLFVSGALSSSFLSFESFKFQTGTGNDSVSGGDLGDEIDSGAGADTLDGGAGADLLVGGGGDDTYIIDNLLDAVYDVGRGVDTIRASLNWSLYSTGCENLVLTGGAAINGYGSTSANLIVGNGAANSLSGDNGNDTLDGGGGADTLTGGAGIDSLIGGLGDDIYFIDASDVVVEAASSGLDTVKTWAASYSLGLHTNIENLTFTGAGNFSATGNAAANVITAGAGADVFNGGAGADTLIGGLGNDTYIIASGDVITEVVNGGVDTVRTLLSSYALGANVEKLIFAGAVAFSGAGNNLANTVTSGAGADTLDGGLGADTLQGGFGNDTYVVNGAGDVILEAANAGTDTVLSSGANYVLGSNIENLTLSGAANTGGVGNTLNNVLRGNAGNNNLFGQAGNDMVAGGAGHDVLYGGVGADNLLGGAGSDAFVLNTAIGAGQVDRFSDFSVADDTIRLENAIFTKFAAAGALNAAFFRVGAAAADANDYVIYNSATGALFYDSNGNIAGGATQIATLSANLALSSADFLVI